MRTENGSHAGGIARSGVQQSGKKPIVVVLHQETSSAGRVGLMLQAAGYPLDIYRPPLGHKLPSTLDAHSGAVVFGGPMSANDPDDYVKHETDWMAVALEQNKPLLGICLGAQMLVNHLGGTVYGHEDGLVEVGWYDIKATDAGKELMDWPSKVYQFHREGFTLPGGCQLLATSNVYPNQAFRYGENAWGIQFHAELTLAMMHRWVVRGAQRFELPGAQSGDAHLRGRWDHDHHLAAWLRQFLGLVFDDGAFTAQDL